MSFVNNSSKLLQLKPIIESRMNASIWTQLGRKLRKFVHGTERVIPRPKPTHPDTVLEEVYQIAPNWVPYERRDDVKRHYMVYKSHKRLVEHNKKIRKLNTKISGGRYGMWDYANSW